VIATKALNAEFQTSQSETLALTSCYTAFDGESVVVRKAQSENTTMSVIDITCSIRPWYGKTGCDRKYRISTGPWSWISSPWGRKSSREVEDIDSVWAAAHLRVVTCAGHIAVARRSVLGAIPDRCITITLHGEFNSGQRKPAIETSLSAGLHINLTGHGYAHSKCTCGHGITITAQRDPLRGWRDNEVIEIESIWPATQLS
jgi:hypothetical protein